MISKITSLITAAVGLKISAGGIGTQIYNTVDQITNYERLALRYSTNRAILETSNGGTASIRDVVIRSQTSNGGNSYSALVVSRSGPFLTHGLQVESGGANAPSAVTGSVISFGNWISSTTSGSVVQLSINPTYNQASGTAANTDFLINRTETAVGSGAQRLIDAQVASISKFYVSNTGVVRAYNTIESAPASGTASGLFATSTGAVDAFVVISAAASQNKQIRFSTGPSRRWAMISNNTAEAGGNAGSNFSLSAYDDSDTFIDTPISIARVSGGTLTLARPTSITGSLTTSSNIASQGNITTVVGAADVYFTVATNAGQTRGLIMRTASSRRWSLVATSATESGSNAGSNFNLTCYDDSDAAIDSPIQVARPAGGTMTLPRPLNLGTGGNFTIRDSGSNNRLYTSSGQNIYAATVSGAALTGHTFQSTTYTGASVAQIGASFASTINQTGTSSFTDILITRTETATGSGAQYFIQAQVGGTNRFVVSNFGTIQTLGSLRLGDATGTGFDARLQLSGNRTATAWGVNGQALRVEAVTYTDNTTAGSGTASFAAITSFGVPTLAATNTLVTTTAASTVYIAGDVAAGTNQTITNSYGLINVGKSRFDGAVIIPSANTLGIQWYNTTDQITNYERLDISWTSNIAEIRSIASGSGTMRTLRLTAVNSANNMSSRFSIFPANQSSSSIDRFTFSTSQSMTSTSGGQAFVVINPAYNQSSGTAANTDLLINRTETAVGSGNQYLIQAQVGSIDRFLITNLGAAGFASRGRFGSTIIDSQGARLTVSLGSVITAWGTSGCMFRVEGATWTDNTTSGSGTASFAAFNSFAAPTLAATNTSVTTSDAATLYIAGSPITGTNQTITRPWSLYIASGASRIIGTLTVQRAVTARTSSGTEAVENSWYVATNEGATTLVARTLPPAQGGLEYTFFVQDSDGISITAASGDTIRFGGTVTAAAGTITSTTVGSSITLLAINATEWVATSLVGTWA